MAMSHRRGDVTAFKSQRAHRYPVRVPVRYRSSDADTWHDGRIENISESGMLFEAEYPVAVNTPVEMKFVLPATMPVEPAEVVCHGRIVRAVPTSKKRRPLALAATIVTYRFRRQDLSQP
jgi:hypothetical protein